MITIILIAFTLFGNGGQRHNNLLCFGRGNVFVCRFVFFVV